MAIFILLLVAGFFGGAYGRVLLERAWGRAWSIAFALLAIAMVFLLFPLGVVMILALDICGFFELYYRHRSAVEAAERQQACQHPDHDKQEDMTTR